MILAVQIWIALQHEVALQDGYFYLINARDFYLGRFNLFVLLRPPLVPYLISLIWHITGISYDAATLVQPPFTVAAAYILFLLLQDMFNLKTAIVGCLLLSVAPILFLWTSTIEVQNVGMLFLLLAVYLLWLGIKRSESFLPLAGGALALATLARYTILVLVPVFPLMLLTLWVGYGKRRKFPWRAIGGAGLVFFLLWLPWLYWNYAHFGNPFASVMRAAPSVGDLSAPSTPWYFFFENMPVLLTIPGSILLLIGLIDKKTFGDKARFAILLYLAAFFIFHTASTNRQLRFSIEWTPALATFAALGFSRIEAHLPSRTKILAWMFVGLWLAAAFASAITFSLAVTQITNRYFGAPGQFTEISAWLKTNISPSVRVATDWPSQFGCQNDRYYYDTWPIRYAVLHGIPANQAIASFARQHNITYFLVRNDYAKEYGFTKDPDSEACEAVP